MKKFLLYSLLCLSCSVLKAQLLFTTLKPTDGLSSRETRCVFRDSEGYVWAGTNNGLNRFDGAHFKLWNKLSTGYPDGLGEIVTTITEHGKEKIWFGTNAGIGILDKNANRVQEIKLNATYKGTRLYVIKLNHDGEGKLWAATNNGLLVEKGGEFFPVSRVYPFAKELDSLDFFHGAFVFDTVRNCFWLGTTNGSYCLDFKKRKLFTPADNPDSIPFFSKDAIISIALDNKGNLWYSNATETSLCHYDFGTKALQQITQINNNPAWKPVGGCNTLFFDKQGRLWISTWLYSAFIRYPDGRFEEIPYNRDLPHSIGYGFFYDAFEDKYGNIWLPTINGLSKLETGGFVERIVQAPSYKFYLTTGFANINTMQLGEDETWWLGKMEGLVKYHTATKTFERFTVSLTNLRHNEVFDLKLINGEVWCATAGGIQIFNPVTKKFRTFNGYPGKKGGEAFIFWILQDRAGFVWSSVWKEGVYRYDPRTGECIHFDEATVANWGDMKVKYSACAYEGNDGKLWIGTGEGIRLFDPVTQKFSLLPTSVVSTSRVTAITGDSKKNIWVSLAMHGIFKFNAAGEVADSITRKNGLPLNTFNDIHADAAGRLWTTSRENLLCIFPDTKEITRVNIPVDFSFNDHWNSLLKKGNLLYATMLDNVVVINTDRYQQLPQHASPLISSFQVFGKEVTLHQNAGINLNYNQNFFSFDFASPFHQEALSMQYAYKLEEFNKDWVYCGRTLTASYTNVPDGKYRFLVKTTDERGKWMNEVSAVAIIIQPPFWKRWWFVSLMAIAVTTGMYFLYRFWKKRKIEKQIDETVDYFANSLYGENSISEICQDIARNCITQLKLEDCVVYLLDEKQNLLVQRAAYGSKNPKDQEIINPIQLQLGEGIAGTAAASGKPVIISNTSKDTRCRRGSTRCLSELAVPIIHEGKAIGVIDSEHTKRNFFTGKHVKALSTIAAITANKIAEARAEEAARESDIQLLEIKKLLAESRLMALRAQMNPHFVFNCLNSIQECIVTQKYGEASLYLNKFSKMFRSVLNNSGKVMVTLAEEREVLELYLILEHMRFEQSFNYSIQTDEELDEDELLVPSMLLQPYVENALWHGLMHKENDRKLSIVFHKKSDATFECIIEDNGIGRRKAQELKEHQSKAKRHVSRGMAITKDRIELLQKQGQHAALHIIDKYNDAGEASGTKVVVELSAYLE